MGVVLTFGPESRFSINNTMLTIPAWFFFIDSSHSKANLSVGPMPTMLGWFLCLEVYILKGRGIFSNLFCYVVEGAIYHIIK